MTDKLKKISITNFQAHKKLVIDLDETITTIVGSSDKGKSAVIRALRFLCLNKPRGNSFIKKGAKETKVSLVVGDHEICRIRGSDNLYFMDGIKLKAFGVGNVPDPVQDILNISETNFQGQHEAPFLLSESPGQISKKINQIVNLSGIDEALSNIASQLRKVKSEQAFVQDRLTEATDKKKSLRWVMQFRKDIKAMIAAKKRYEEKSHRIALLRELFESATDIKTSIDRSSKTIVCVSSTVESGRKLATIKDKRENLKKLISEAVKSKIIATRTVPDISDLLSVRADADQTADQFRTLEQLLQKAIKAKEYLCRLKTNLAKVQKSIPKICPTCKNPILSSSSAPTCTSH